MRILILASLCAGLCGCVQSIDAPLSPTFGQALAKALDEIAEAVEKIRTTAD